MIGLIVDGEGDYAAFNARYKGKVRVLKADGPRGHKVSEIQVVTSAKKQISILRAWGCRKIAIVTDFEGRDGSADEFCSRAMAFAEKFDPAKGVVVFAPDRMLENWFLADVLGITSKRKYLRSVKSQKKYESSDGKAELKKLFVNGFVYNEIKHSADLFPLVDGQVAERNSRSFARFKNELGID